MVEVTALAAETLRHLQALIQLDTSNPPGNESLVVSYLADVLRSEGLQPTILEKVPGRANLIARLRGRGEAAPLLLMAHTDVVPAAVEQWEQPPFGGIIDDGFLWGRGALDMKCMLAYELVVLLNLNRIKAPLTRDVIFAATADEEGFGSNRCGMAFVAQEYPELVQAEFALNELGGMTLWFGHLPVYPIIVGEKGACQMRMCATGKPAHASTPASNTAVAKLCVALSRLDRFGLPIHCHQIARMAMRKVARAYLPNCLSWLDRLITRVSLLPPAQQKIKSNPMYRPLYEVMHNTAMPTLLQAGTKFNVLPAQAEATLNGRYLPGVTRDEFYQEVATILGEDVTLELAGCSTPLEFPFRTRLFEKICTTVEALHPGSTAIPWIMSGGTDAAHVARLGATVYGFSPVRFEQGFNWQELIHGDNERIPMNGMSFGVVALWEVVNSFVRT